MSLQTTFHAIQSLPPMQAFRESALTYPVIMATHLAMIAVGGGMILLSDLRLLGLALTDYKVSDVLGGLKHWKHAALTIMVFCGIMLGGSEADKYYPNPYFWTKMTMLTLAVIHFFVFKSSVYRNTAELDKATTMPGSAKLAGALSLAIWTTTVCMGRLIAYYEPK